MGIVFACAECGLELTHPVELLPDPTRASDEMGKARVSKGSYLIEELGAAQLDWFVLHPSDAVHTTLTKDLHRLNGCCGLDGQGGKNTLCDNGHEIGTEFSDCWRSQGLYLDPKSVVLKEQSKR
jgi:hypothetical protein